MTDLSISTRVELPLQTRLAPVGNVDAEARTAELIWSTGAAVRRFSWQRGAEYWEELSLDPKHVRMDRLRNGAPLLSVHNAFELGAVLGVVERADLSGGKGTASVRFSDRDEVEPVFRDVKSKIIRNVSVGYVVHRLLETGEIRDGLPVFRAIDWEPMELSLVPINADAGAHVRSESSGGKTFPCEIATRGTPMENTAAPTEGISNTQATLAERSRVSGITALVREYPLLTAEDQRRWIEDGTPLDQVRTQALEAVIARQHHVRRYDPYAAGMGGMDYSSPAAQRSLMVEAISCRLLGKQPSEAARPFANRRLTDLAGDVLRWRDVNVNHMSPNQIMTRVFQSGSDFPGILADAQGKALLDIFNTAESGIKLIARKATAADFKQRALVRLSEASSLEKVLPGAEIKRGFFTDSKTTYGLVSYAKIFGVNRQTIINDDLNAFVDIPRAMALSAAEVEASELAGLVNSNPQTYDGVATFHVNHSNLAASGAAIDVTTLGAGQAALRLQKGIAGVVPLGLAARYLVVPAALESRALQYVATLTPAQASNVNPFAAKLEVVVDPRLDAASTTAWYLAAAPSLAPSIEYCYLENEEGPQVSTRDGWDVEGMEFKVRLDYACSIIDWRGLYKNPGA